RANRMQVSRHVTDLLLKSVDVMRDMLRSVQRKEPIDAQKVADLQFDLELAIAQKNQPAAAPAVAAPAPVAAAPVEEAKPAGRRWRILFRPYPQLFVHGNDPLRMIRELGDLGDLKVKLDGNALPSLDELEPESCYLAWELTLDGDIAREA